MATLTDEDIRNKEKITCQIAANYLSISSLAVSIGMRNNLLPIGFAIHNDEKDHDYHESWSYVIIPERLIAYKHGRIQEAQVTEIDKDLKEIIEKFESLRSELVFALSENAETTN